MENTTYVNFWGLEVTQSSGGRDKTRDETNDYTAGLWAASGAVKSHHVNFINMIFHDVQFSTFGWYTSQTDSEMYGSLIYQNGSTSKDHGLYVKNSGPQKRIIDNIIIDNASHGIHAYSSNGTSEQALDNLYIEGNIIAQNGSIGYDDRNGSYGRLSRNILVGGTSALKAKNTTIKNNFTYHPATSTGASLNVGYSGGSENTVISGNYLMGGRFEIGGTATGLSVSDNTIYYTGISGISTSNYSSNTWTTTKPAGVKKVIRPNKYESGRANIAIYNWSRASSISLTSADLVNVSLKSGDRYELHNAQNYFGDVITGTFNGSSINIPMTGRSVATPRGITYKPPTTFPEFGAFVLINISASSPIVATPVPTIRPTSTPTPRPTQTPTPTPTPVSVTRTVIPIADASTLQSEPTKNFGSTAALSVDSDPSYKKPYMKFDVSVISGKALTSAILRLKTGSSSSAASGSSIDIRGLEEPTASWTESGITYNNRPKLTSTSYAAFKPSSANTWYSVNVTRIVTGRSGNTVTIGLDSTGTDGADFQSRETTDKPQLILTYQ